MHITGTTHLMDLWADLQMQKGIVKKPLSEEAKKELIDIYDEYKRLGGTKTDHQVEEWKKGIERLRKENATLKKELKQFIGGVNGK